MKKFILPFIVLIAISSCSTIVSKSQYPVAIGSTPEDVKFTITDKNGVVVHSGVTPEQVILSTKGGYFKKPIYNVTYKKRGYDTQTQNLTPTIDAWYWGNIAFGGLIGFLIVDPITGAMYKLPKEINVSLSSNRHSENRSLNIINIDDLSPSQKSNLIRIN